MENSQINPLMSKPFIAIASDPKAFKMVPEDLRNYKLSRLAVEKFPSNIEHVPADLQEELFELAVRLDGTTLRFVPEDLRDEELIRIATLTQFNLKDIPEKYRTEEVCRKAIECKDIFAIDFTPRSLLSEDLIIDAIRVCRCYFERVPDELITQRICEVYLDREGFLYNIPERFINWNMCLRAVQGFKTHDGTEAFNLNSVPREFLDQTMIETGLNGLHCDIWEDIEPHVFEAARNAGISIQQYRE